MSSPYSHKSWPALRAAVLKRDGHRCRIRGKGCQKTATDCDHIVGWRDGGAWLDPENLQAACGPCNNRKGAVQKNREGWRRSDVEIVKVEGPPAGVNAWVESNKTPGDIAFIHNQLAGVVGSEDVADQLWLQVNYLVRRGDLVGGPCRVFISDRRKNDLPYHTRVIVTSDGERVKDGDKETATEPGRW